MKRKKKGGRERERERELCTSAEKNRLIYHALSAHMAVQSLKLSFGGRSMGISHYRFEGVFVHDSTPGGRGGGGGETRSGKLFQKTERKKKRRFGGGRKKARRSQFT